MILLKDCTRHVRTPCAGSLEPVYAGIERRGGPSEQLAGQRGATSDTQSC
jgi:hypothetical protein